MKAIRKIKWLIIIKWIFEKEKISPDSRGRCTECHAGNPVVLCSGLHCPCDENECLKLKRIT